MSDYKLCNHCTIHLNHTCSFCFRPENHAGAHCPGADPAYGGYFIVTALVPHRLVPHQMFGRLDIWQVSGYTAEGDLILMTSHTTAHSKDMEVRAWESRGATERKTPCTGQLKS